MSDALAHARVAAKMAHEQPEGSSGESWRAILDNMAAWSLLSIAESLADLLDEGTIDVNVAQYDGDRRVR